MESVQQQSFPISEARLISPASRPLSKSSPKVLVVLVIAALGGLGLGFGIGILRDLSERVFRTSEQIENSLQTTCISLVPLLADDNGGVGDRVGEAGLGGGRAWDNKWWSVSALSSLLPYLMGNRAASEAPDKKNNKPVAQTGASNLEIMARHLENAKSFWRGAEASSTVDANQGPNGTKSSPAPARSKKGAPRTIVSDNIALRRLAEAPFSRFAEAIRSIKLSIDLNGAVKTSRTIGITSCSPNEGKSTLAAALAQLISQVEAKTILVDCDLRNPSLSRALAPGATCGLLEVLSGKMSLEDAIWKDPITNLNFLPVVLKSRLAHSNEVLSSPGMKELFERLRESYAYIIADFSPLAPIVDVRVTTSYIDSYLLVVEWGRTRIDVVHHALAHAQGIYENLLGVVLNKVDMSVFGRYAGSHKNYYYNEHYGRYGYTE